MARTAAVLLGPVVLAQAKRLRAEAPELPEADGERRGGEGEPRVLVLGDSTAVGVGVRHLDDSVAGHLHRRLGGSWRVVGRSGDTAEDIRRDWLAEASAEPCDVAVLLIGWNDAMQLRAPSAFADDLQAILAALRETSPDAQLVVVSPPDFEGYELLPQPLKFALMQSAAGIADAAARVAEESGAIIVAGFDGRHVARDRFHPDETGYALLARAVAKAIGA